VPKSLAHEETVESTRAHSQEGFDPEWIRYVFTAWAQCTHPSCNEKFAIAGNGGVSPEYTSNEGDWDWEDFFSPLFCYPMPEMIEFPNRCPKDVKTQLSAAFALFWSNEAACAGRIRVALEQLMNHIGVPKRKKNSNGRYSDLTLHARIDAYAAKDAVIGPQLMALKWLGNTGSHNGEISKADLLDALEILEHVLGEILERRSARVASLAKTLTKKHRRK